ncbi:MAG: hypothetical protein KBT12_01500 [Bacteroidales bacterium]|nr:hypothetical protein [Candidatus Physcousia equi]
MERKSPRITHFFLTRFNLPLWKQDKKGGTTLTDAWLQERMRLFEHYTYASLLSQTCKQFFCVVLLDELTPAWCKDTFSQWTDRLPQLRPVYVSRQEECNPCLLSQRYIADYFDSIGRMPEGIVLTSYLDSDDAISADFVERMRQEAVGASVHTFFTFKYGVQWFDEYGIGTRICYPNNHFITLVEHEDEVRTCFDFGGHFFLFQQKDVTIRVLKDEQMWMEVIHRGNVDNDVKMTFHTSLIHQVDDLLARFGLRVSKSRHPKCTFATRFMVRAVGQVWRRAINKLKCS